MLGVSGSHWVCPHSRRVCFPGLHCLHSRLLCWETSMTGPGLRALPISTPLRFRFSGTPQRHRFSWVCVSCLSQVQTAQVTRCLVIAHSSGAVHFITSPVSATQFPGCVATSQVCHVSLLGSWSLAATLLMDVNCPGSQEDLVSDWEPDCSLVGDAISGAKFAHFLPALVGTRLPPCLQQGMGQSAALLWYSLSPLFCERARQGLSALG